MHHRSFLFGPVCVIMKTVLAGAQTKRSGAVAAGGRWVCRLLLTGPLLFTSIFCVDELRWGSSLTWFVSCG